MKLPKSFTTITPFSKLIAGSLFIIAPIIAFYLGTLYSSSKGELTPFVDNQVTQLKKELEEKEAETLRCIYDNAQQINYSINPYSFNEFGIYSPLFEGKEMEIREYDYRRNQIKERTIMIGKMPYQDGESNLKVSVWEFSERIGFASDDSGNRRVIFTGYENYTLHPTRVSELATNWKQEFVSENDLTFYWNTEFCPGSGVCALYLEMLQLFSPSGNPILVRISANLLTGEDINDKSLNDPKEELKKIANSIDIRLR